MTHHTHSYSTNDNLAQTLRLLYEQWSLLCTKRQSRQNYGIAFRCDNAKYKKEVFKNMPLLVDFDKNNQQAIVETLDCIQKAINNKTDELPSLDELVKSRFILQAVV